MTRPQTQRTVISMLGSYGSIGDDGATRQTPERCLTGAKSCFELWYLNIHGLL